LDQTLWPEVQASTGGGRSATCRRAPGPQDIRNIYHSSKHRTILTKTSMCAPNNLELLDPTTTPYISVQGCPSFDGLLHSEVAPLSAPEMSPHNLPPPPSYIPHPDLARVARDLSDTPGARPGLTCIVGPRLPHGAGPSIDSPAYTANDHQPCPLKLRRVN
jgi:hypothetical protein